MKKIQILGSTGSIGTQALEVIEGLNYQVTALSAFGNIELLEKQIRKFKPEYACVYQEDKGKELKTRIKDTETKVLWGAKGLLEIVTLTQEDILLNALVGIVGLEPTIAAIKCKKTIALANKETLVSGGQLVIALAKEYGVNIIPVDSELSAIFQCLQDEYSKKTLNKILLTASGGPFFGKTTDELKEVTIEKALKHPNWAMGPKVTIDSATLMNKGLELIESTFLFDMEEKDVEVLVHRQSIVHSMVQFKDNSVLAQLSDIDMKIPIQYALTYPNREKTSVKPLNFTDVNSLTFAPPDMETFQCLALARKSLNIGGLAPCALNVANEVAVELFLAGKISFLTIQDVVKAVLSEMNFNQVYTLEDVFATNQWVREWIRKHQKELSR